MAPNWLPFIYPLRIPKPRTSSFLTSETQKPIVYPKTALSTVPFPYLPQTNLPTLVRPFTYSTTSHLLNTSALLCVLFSLPSLSPMTQTFNHILTSILDPSHHCPSIVPTLLVLHNSNHDFLHTCPQAATLLEKRSHIAMLTGQANDPYSAGPLVLLGTNLPFANWCHSILQIIPLQIPTGPLPLHLSSSPTSHRQ